MLHRALDCPAVEEARRAMVSAGYKLPPQCQPIPLDPPTARLRASPPRTTAPAAHQPPRRHSISCSPVHGVLPSSAAAAVAAASFDAQRVGQKRRFSLPDNGCGLEAGVPLTAFLPSEFKRRRRSASLTPSSTSTSSVERLPFFEQPQPVPALPCINELVQGAMMAPGATTTGELPHPEPCLPPHTAATPDHPRFAPSLSAPTPLEQQQQQQQHQLQSPLSAITNVHQLPYLVYNNSAGSSSTSSSSASTSPASSTPSSPRQFDSLADQQQARDEALAEKARRAERVAEVLELMDRQNSGGADAAAIQAALDSADATWSAGDAKRRRVGKDQTGILDLMFKVEPMPTQATKKRLADGLGMTYKQVQIWFQNKRARCKRAVEAPPRSSHTFHNMLVSSDGRFMMKELAKAQQEQHQHQQPPAHLSYGHHDPSAAPPVALRSCILTQ